MSTPRTPALDGLRGLAILGVLISHVLGLLGAGLVGVLIFFVLSGYLITWLLLDEFDRTGRIDLRAFYIRRALRLLPALLVFLLLFGLVALVPAVRVQAEDAVHGILLAVTYLTDIGFGFQHGYARELAHLWSLAVEEQFYLLWPLTLIAILRMANASRRVERVTQLVLAAAVLRLLTMAVAIPLNLYFYVLPSTWVDSLLVGALVAIVRRDAPTVGQRWALVAGRPAGVVGAVAVLGVFALAPGTYTWSWTYAVGIPLLNAAAAVLVVGSLGADSTVPRLLSWPPLVTLGGLSYALYLYNSTAIMLTERALGDVWTSRWLGLGIALTLAVLSRRWVEAPALRLKARLGRPRPVARHQ